MSKAAILVSLKSFGRYWLHFITQFFKECYHAWRSEVFSTIGIGIVAFLLTHGKDAGAKDALLVTLKACLIWLAIFAAYHLIRTPWILHREVQGKLAKQATQDEIKKQIVSLSQLIERGQDFTRRCRGAMDLVPEAEVNAWAAEVTDSVQKVFDDTYITRLRSGVGIPMGMAYWPNMENRHVDGFVLMLVYRLQEFIDELRRKLSN